MSEIFKKYFLDDSGFFDLRNGNFVTKSTISFFEITEKNKFQFEVFIEAVKNKEIEILYETFCEVTRGDLGFIAFRFTCPTNKSGLLICYTNKNIIRKYEFPDELKLLVELI